MQKIGEAGGLWAAIDAAAERATRSRRAWALFTHEFVAFGVKQAWAWLFGGCMVALLLVTGLAWPKAAPIARYDFLTVAAVTLQVGLVALRLETRREAAIILLFHGVGTAMEIFKTAMGSWAYPEPCLLRIGGVPLFTGFMYAAVGSYIARAWRLFDFRFTAHPPLWAGVALAVAIYANFFTHHFLPDIRPLLFGALALAFGPTWVHFRIRRTHRRMPLMVGLVLVALFIWFAENAGTFAQAWVYPAQRHGWHPVAPEKIGAWLLLMTISYVMVWAMHRHAPGYGDAAASQPP